MYRERTMIRKPEGVGTMRARLIYNPTAGREVVERRIPSILERLEGYGLETSCHATRGPGDAVKAADAAVRQGFDIVIAAGGDGTVHEVANGIARHPRRPRLGILPCGTSNDLARALRLPRDLLAACDVIGRGETRPMDVGRVGERFFVNVAAAGWLTEVTYEVPSRLKTLLGRLAYYAKGLEKMNVLLHPFHVRLETESLVMEEEIFLFLAANSPVIGGFDQLAPRADLSDGKLDVLIIRKVGIPDLVQLIGMVLRGNHVNDPRVVYMQTDRLRVTLREPMKLNLDGEWGGELTGEVDVVHGHLEVLC